MCLKTALLVFFATTFVNAALSQCITSFNSSANYFPNGYSSPAPFSLSLAKANVNSATKFAVQYDNAYKLVSNYYDNTSYLLYQCGAPVLTDFNASVKPIEVPVTSVAIDSTIPIAFFELLGLLSVIKADSLEYATPYVSSPCFQKLIQENKVAQLNSSTNDFETFKGVVLTSLQGTPSYSFSFVYFDATQDPGPLKRAEWIKYLAVFFNLEENATAVYNQIEANYQCLNGSNVLTQKPVFAWLSEYPAGYFTFSNASYKSQLVSDAGGLTLNSSAFQSGYNLSIPAEAAAFYAVLSGVDVMIDEIFAPSPQNYTIATFLNNTGIKSTSSFKFLTSKQVWREDRRVSGDGSGLDWFEGAIPQPQIILQEFLGIVNPGYNSTHYFFRNIAKGEKVVSLSPSDCATDPTAPVSPTIFQCPYTTTTTPSSSPLTSGAADAYKTWVLSVAVLTLGVVQLLTMA